MSVLAGLAGQRCQEPSDECLEDLRYRTHRHLPQGGSIAHQISGHAAKSHCVDSAILSAEGQACVGTVRASAGAP